MGCSGPLRLRLYRGQHWRREGQTLGRVLLGLFLGPVGWIVMAAMEPTPEKQAERNAFIAEIQRDRAEEAAAMRGQPPRPGWWLASDGNWYPPDTSHAG